MVLDKRSWYGIILDTLLEKENPYCENICYGDYLFLSSMAYIQSVHTNPPQYKKKKKVLRKTLIV